jgi:hypothetical protein
MAYGKGIGAGGERFLVFPRFPESQGGEGE